MKIFRSVDRRSGFTLIELVISSALMALVLASGYLCLSSGVTSQRLIESRADAVQTGRVVLNIISADLRSACVLSKEVPFLGMDRMVDDSEADNLDFGTHNYKIRRRGESDFCEVSYFINKAPGTNLFTLWRRRDASPDEQPLAGGIGEEIAQNVSGLMFEYYDGFEWFDDWGDLEGRSKGMENAWLEHPNWFGMPEAVRITIWIVPKSTTSSRPADQTAQEPAMAFRTVARLNLAPLSQDAALDSSSSAGTSSTSAPGGGNP